MLQTDLKLTVQNELTGYYKDVQMQYVHFRSHIQYFCLPWIIPEEISRRPMLFYN